MKKKANRYELLDMAEGQIPVALKTCLPDRPRARLNPGQDMEGSMATGFDLFSVRGGGFAALRTAPVMVVLLLTLFAGAPARAETGQQLAGKAVVAEEAAPARLQPASVETSGKKDSKVQTLSWLMSEPVTMMDLGIVRLRQDLDQTARRLFRQGDSLARGDVGAWFDWRSKQIIAWISLPTSRDFRNQHQCGQRFQQVADMLTSHMPVKTMQEAWYLTSLFGHQGGAWFNPDSLPEDMLGLVRLEVSLAGHPEDVRLARDWDRVSCGGALNASLEDLGSGPIEAN